ncbi:response regulator [Desulfobaculum bizertense]|uniref:Response regulator receiver domain-containing protein n=1 Tax=Desulfobaculum bizertense DSM 18034 TaxID=1121442 RepID=A0A1T4WGT1_9BACT|nr:response regulator [Desulfobaculum bizertense]UIJ39386.1 response regulator [Desulfobaculum bizertense]SKA76544.1 Response regulator receiver domain-containing protein [Desulfobaculum bizertense DSM 18034]
MHVLLVEDECITRECARLSLQDHGYTVTAVPNGHEAVELAKKSPWNIDVVFMDLQMPIMDGREAAKQLKNIPAAQDTPIVAVSACDTCDSQNCTQNGFAYCLAKPYNVLDLLRKLKEVFPSTHS